MLKRRRQSFTLRFKARVVREVLARLKDQPGAARRYQLKFGSIARKKDIVSDGVDCLFQGDVQRGRDQDRIAGPERIVGRLAMKREVVKKATDLLPSVPVRSGVPPDAGGRVSELAALPGARLAWQQRRP